MGDNLSVKLPLYLTEDAPFGPIDATEIVEDDEVFLRLFEQHNKIHSALLKRPSIVIGRKGSGKTSYLQSAKMDRTYKYVINIDTQSSFSTVIEAISRACSNHIFAESVRKLWATVLFIGLFTQIRGCLPQSYNRSKALISDYLAKIGIRDEGSIDDVFWDISDIITKHYESKPQALIMSVLMSLDRTTFKSALHQLERDLARNDHRVIMLMDNLDDFNLDVNEVGRALQGLLKFIGESNGPNSRIDIRFCLPAELYQLFLNYSANPNKDFRRSLLLHWTSPELIALAAHRLHLFSTTRPQHFLAIDDELESVINNPAKVLKKKLPAIVRSRLGIEEDSLAYILRHTQLLPRHLLMLLNAISNEYRRFGAFPVGDNLQKSIIRGIGCVEQKLVKEIFIAYKYVYDRAEQVCSACIPELHHVFSIGDLERVFRSHGKVAFQSDDFSKFKIMLIEIGAVGRALGYDNSSRYIKAEFEYTVPHKLVSSTDDMLCIHPLFTKVFSAKIRENKPVYPYGCKLDDPDYRIEYYI
jgi:hypothetical protein